MMAGKRHGMTNAERAVRSMMDRSFREHVLKQLAAMGEITARPMFGGHSLYWRDTIFGVVFGERLYFKVDDQSKGDFVSRGMGPFRPNERQSLNSYYQVPPEVLAEPEALLSWAREAIRAAQSSTTPG
jgi:DNA transformation protein